MIEATKQKEGDATHSLAHLGRVALLHDFLLYPGGAEKVLVELAGIFPEAPIYTLLYDAERMEDMLDGREVRTSFLGQWPQWIRRRHRWLLPFYAPAIESLDLRAYDTVISSSGAWSKGLVTRLNTRHITYTHSTMRFVWDENERYMQSVTGRHRFPLRQLLSYIRVWDYQAAQRPERLIANARYTQGRITKYYRRSSEVVYPPVAFPSWDLMMQRRASAEQTQVQKPFVIIARLVPYKNVALAIEVCNKLQFPLIVIGDGPEMSTLQKEAGETILFKGWTSEDEKWEILASARALLFPCEDDFGIVCVEALAAGIPVVTLDKGGSPEILEGEKYGITFAVPRVEVMADGIRRLIEQEERFVPEALRARAEVFACEVFRGKMRAALTTTERIQ